MDLLRAPNQFHRRPTSTEPDPAFLPLPDGEVARRSSAGGLAFASLKQRRISGGGSAGGGSGAAGLSGAATPVERTQGSNGSGYFSVALSKLGSSVASYVSAGGASAAGSAPEKDQ
jgi:hypothetical protein